MRNVKLDDKYNQASGVALMNGTQALVRLPILQRQADKARGWNTAGFISGYRGSPIGNYDLELWRAQKHLDTNDILFQPGVNEDLAATAVWGTQMLESVPNPKHEGVFAIWYGKGPGVDRSGDPFKHGNTAGTHPKGGVLICAGDDHAGKSSTVAHQSEIALMHAGMPILAPSNVQDLLDMGMLGFAMSRYTGLYTGFKLCNEVLEQTMTAQLPDINHRYIEPDRGEAPPTGFHNYPTHLDRQYSDQVVKRYRWPLVAKFVRANGLDKVLVNAPKRKLGIVSTGKAVQDVKQALKLLGLSDEAAGDAGISFYKLGCMFPVEPEGLASFATDHSELLIIEEKEGLVEQQAKALLYSMQDRPLIVGKQDETGLRMIPDDDQLDPSQLAIVIAERLGRLGVDTASLQPRVDKLKARLMILEQVEPAEASRSPYFCSGCPHNTSTRFPEGSVAAGGIGCHAMAMYSGPEMMPNAQMGGEGAHWYSLGHFSDTPHIFQNMGDGTYYHSGLLAVRGAVAAKVNMTFKILFNDAVAMTGGQPVDGPLSVGDITRQVMAEGAVRCVVVTDRPDLYNSASGLAPGVKVEHRDRLDDIQKDLREINGVTVLVYEQTCAAEKRRRRKRGKFPDPAKRMYINPAVCEGCGDCSVKSNCVSVWPLETELGRKRQIDQSSCNKDYSCVKGFCPSFVTVLGAEPKKPPQSETSDEIFTGLPDPEIRTGADGGYNIMISGIGGTGVVTIGALLAMAAHLEEKACSVFDMTGLSQKNGAVYTHLRIADRPGSLGAQKLGVGEADLALAFDVVAALSAEPFTAMSDDRTTAVANARVSPTPAFQRNPDLRVNQKRLMRQLEDSASASHAVDASGLGLGLLGDTIAANLFLLGYAYQLGLLPVSADAIMLAVELNGVAIPFNKKAFSFGRLQAVDPDRVKAEMVNKNPDLEFQSLEDLDDIVAHRTDLLTRYQNASWAERYRASIDKIIAAEEKAAPGKTKLSVAVARNLAKLMTYKDEYEVARLHMDPTLRARMLDGFEPGAKLKYNLAPPMISKRDPQTGELQKREFGVWIEPLFKLLTKMKGLRGTRFDLFGYTDERRMERGLITRYETLMTEIADKLDADNYAVAIELASLPETIRGYGHIKDANVAKARSLEEEALERFREPGAKPTRIKLINTVSEPV